MSYWPDETVLKLIEAYKSFRILWDPRDINFYKKDMKDEAWKQIGFIMDQSVSTCRNKMISLLSSYRRENGKVKKSRAADSEEPYITRWFAYESFKFLNERKKPRTASSISKSGGSTSAAPIQGIKLRTSLASQTPPETPIKEHLFSSNERKKQRCEYQRPEKVFDTSAASANDQNDECHHFGNLIASKMRTYDSRLRCAIQNDIMSIFLKASIGFYDHYLALPVQHSEDGQSSSNRENHHSLPNRSTYNGQEPPQIDPPPSPNYNSELSADEFSAQDMM